MRNVHYTYRIMTVPYEDTEDVFRSQTPITGKFTTLTREEPIELFS